MIFGGHGDPFGCVSGHVRKVQTDGMHDDVCPVPFVKVEIFDVDREACWWPWLSKWWDVVLDRHVIRIPELLKERPFLKPFPQPDPAPELKFSPLVKSVQVALNPQPLPPFPATAYSGSI